MPKPTLKTPARIERMLALHREGHSAREIARLLKVGNHGTINDWLRDAGLKPNGSNRNGNAREPPGEAEASLAAAQQELAELATGPVPRNLDEVLERLRGDFALAQAFVRSTMARATKGHASMAELEKAIKIEDAFATRIRELTPHEPPDPEKDPHNVEAAAAVRRKFALLVETAEREARCKHCGKNPFGED